MSRAAESPDARTIALQRVGGSESTLKLIVQKFTEEAPRLLEEATKAIETKAARDCERAAHTLKGAADILALSELVALALEVELLGRANDLEAAAVAMPRLRIAVDEAFAQIATWTH